MPMWSSGRACQQYLHIAKFWGYNWWIAVILGFKIGGCGTIRDYDGFKLGCSVLSRRQIGTRRCQRTTKKSRLLPMCWSKFSYILRWSRRLLGDQVQVRPELVRSNQVVNPMRGLWRKESEMEMKSKLFNYTLMWAHGAYWLFLDLNVFKSRGRLLELWLEYIMKVDKDSEIKNGHFCIVGAQASRLIAKDRQLVKN